MPVDFNNRDEDGAVRLITRGTLSWLKEHALLLSDGQPIRITDGELIAEALVKERNGYWVATVVGYL